MNTTTPTNRFLVWVAASRPKTLAAAASPVVVGSILAWSDGVFYLPAALCALVGALLIQIGTNFSNDYSDFLKGADTDSRKGPLRVTQAGLVSANQMKRATFLVFGAAFVVGLYLIYRGGWPVFLIGILSILSGIWYTAGRYSLAYLGLGDLFVLIFFGPVAVGGTYYVQATTGVSSEALWMGFAVGALSVAILLSNNLRDVAEDRMAGKKTLVVRFGVPFGAGLYATCFLAAATIPVYLFLTHSGIPPGTLAASVLLVPGLRLARILLTQRSPNALNPVLGRTARLLILYCLLYTLGRLVWA